jgi:hypothetical protein
MDAKLELLWRLTEEQQQLTRYHDEERSKLAQYLLVVAAAAVGVAKIGDLSLVINTVLGGFVVLTGCVRLILTVQQSHACAGGVECANKYRAKLLELCPDLPALSAPHYTTLAPLAVPGLL